MHFNFARSAAHRHEKIQRRPKPIVSRLRGARTKMAKKIEIFKKICQCTEATAMIMLRRINDLQMH